MNEKKFCRFCGNQLNPGSCFCNNCGNKVNSVEVIQNEVFIDPDEEKNKKLDNTLKVGVTMVVLAIIIFMVSSWNIITDFGKTGILIFLGLIFLGLYKFCDNVIKIHKTAKAYYLISMFVFISAYFFIGMNNVFGSYFSMYGEGSNLYYMGFFSLIALVSFSYDKIFNSLFSKYILRLSLIGVFENLLLYFNLSAEYLILLNSFVLILTIKSSAFSEISLKTLYIFHLINFLLLAISGFDNLYIHLIALALSSIVSFAFMENGKSSVSNKFVPFILVINYYVFSFSNFEIDYALILSAGLISCTLLFYYIKQIKVTNADKILSTLICNLNLLNLFILSLFFEASTNLFVTLFLVLPFIVVIFINELDTSCKIEKYLEVPKVFLLTISVINLINSFGTITLIESLLVFSAISIIFSIFKEEESILKNVYKIIFYITFGFVFLNNLIIADNFNSLILVLLSVFYYLSVGKSKEKDVAIYISMFCFIRYLLLIQTFNSYNIIIASAVSILCLISIFIYSKKEKDFKIKFISSMLFLMSLANFGFLFDNNYIHLSLDCFHYLIIIFILSTLFLHKNKEVVLIILSSLVFLDLIFAFNGIAIFALVIYSSIFIMIGFKFNYYKKFLPFGITVMIVGLIIQGREVLSEVPIWIYLLIVGIGIIVFVMKKEIQNRK